MAKRILIVDDEPLIVKGLKYSLEQDGYETASAADGEEAVQTFFAGQYDLVLLDVMLPKFSGIEVCQRIREKSNVPIIMLTAKGEDMDKILGLEYGADDYMTKPFNILEVKARIKTILRRTGQMARGADARTITIRDMVINLNNRSVVVGEKEVNLTAKEFDLLQLFATHRGKVFSREALLETIWKYDYLGDLRTVDVHIRRLREKIEKNPAQQNSSSPSGAWGITLPTRTSASGAGAACGARYAGAQTGSGLSFCRRGPEPSSTPSAGELCSPTCSSSASRSWWSRPV
jgi:DNA-binding response OmpR family regulator